MNSRVTAVFDTQTQAEQAINALRQLGVNDTQLSIVAQHGKDMSTTGTGTAAAAADEAAAEKASDTTRGLAAGAGVGAMFGLAAALIPGVGPFITAGALLTHALGAVGGGMVAGAVVGGTTGAVAGALAHAGYPEHEATYYGNAVQSGSILVAVDTDGSAISPAQVSNVLTQYGGHFATA